MDLRLATGRCDTSSKIKHIQLATVQAYKVLPEATQRHYLLQTWYSKDHLPSAGNIMRLDLKMMTGYDGEIKNSLFLDVLSGYGVFQPPALAAAPCNTASPLGISSGKIKRGHEKMQRH
ncbi:uncharacterized protein RCO7_08474 [Rhynchosporium graminicola]|uniref:Uncharacterized protein n=1 Tax=Rhynchosporium graminicola TaxID=2792576 RepID=A0A1E1L4L2_9HELO|nr:uncharacterized protein RCO7_08474 [Rhynchosporium commune]